MGKFIDLTGMTFGEWTVIDYAGNSYWNCVCSCSPDVIRQVHGKSLRNGVSKSCGHDTASFKDITGQVFGKWKVLEYVGDRKWCCECQCSSHTIKIVSGHDLRSGRSTNCGCIRSEKLAERNSQSRIKLEGKTFGEWEVLRYYGDKHYICRCSCSRIKKVASRDLVKGISKSCGHNNGKNLIRDISGEKFGELTVIRYVGHKTWECKCSCGNITNVRKHNLLNGSVKSCGCKQYDRITKEEIQRVIKEFYDSNGELPFIQDLSAILDRHEAHIRRYIKNYSLQDYINNTYDSIAEREIYNTFKNGELHRRDIIGNGQEIDIYYPQHKLAIEFNGDYWHSSECKEPDYHQKKSIACIERGIRLIHIFEHEWNNKEKRNKIISIINNIVNSDNISKIYARDTEVKRVPIIEAEKFINTYHIQNYTKSTVHIGCYKDKELLGIMTFGKPRFNNDYEWELIRLCWKDNVMVVGGAEKLFSNFISNITPKSIITYTDLSKFTGNVYKRLGFKVCKDGITKPNYKWVNPGKNSVLSRYQTQKHILIEDGLGTEDQTEDEIMKSLGYYKIYDSGNLKLEWIKQ